jgi:hypothetical protein
MLQRLAAISFVSFVAFASGAVAQPAAQAPSEWRITDNSFLVEEAFNQDAGIVQHIFGFQRQNGRNWAFTFTQEWPAPRMRHQLSYTIPVQSLDGHSGFGDVLINYRLQVLEEGPGRPAFSPRVSVILPSGDDAAGAGTHGVQVNLPFSKHRGDVYFHANGGFTWQRTPGGASIWSPSAAGSLIYRAKDMLNLMLESVVVRPTESPTAMTISPGVRGGWNLTDEKQIVVGLAAPITRSGGGTTGALFLYFSYEGPVSGLPKK